MNIISTAIPEVLIIEPKVFEDQRGYFFESFNEAQFTKAVPHVHFIQDNESKSQKGVIRGLHYQLPPFAQSKLVRVIVGCVLDVVVDLRKGSSTFGQHVSVELSGENKRQLFVPRGCAHGYAVLSDYAIFAYKVDNVYSKESERGIIYNDPALGIDWQIDQSVVRLSEKDIILPLFKDAVYFEEL